MKRFTITITGYCADTVSDALINEMAVAAEVQVIEPDLFGTADVLTVTAIERGPALPDPDVNQASVDDLITAVRLYGGLLNSWDLDDNQKAAVTRALQLAESKEHQS